MMRDPPVSLLNVISWTSLLALAPVLMADQTVFLDRMTASLWEPYFNPKSIVADVGEKINFVARFDDVKTNYGTVSIIVRLYDINASEFYDFCMGFCRVQFFQPVHLQSGFSYFLYIVH